MTATPNSLGFIALSPLLFRETKQRLALHDPVSLSILQGSAILELQRKQTNYQRSEAIDQKGLPTRRNNNHRRRSLPNCTGNEPVLDMRRKMRTQCVRTAGDIALKPDTPPASRRTADPRARAGRLPQTQSGLEGTSRSGPDARRVSSSSCAAAAAARGKTLPGSIVSTPSGDGIEYGCSHPLEVFTHRDIVEQDWRASRCSTALPIWSSRAARRRRMTAQS